jgi:hypothetical protein
MKKKAQSNQYDKIFKENIEAVIPNLMKKLLNITAVFSEELPDDIQHTKERKPDVLKRITDVEGNIFVLQIEFQVADEPEMVYRMGDYYLMLERKYKIPVEQYVIFIGDGRPTMPTILERKRMKFEFPLITLSELDYHTFLNSDKPEEVVLGILGDFREENPEKVLKQIIKRIEETTESDFALKRHFQQLRILAQLRNLTPKIDEIMLSVTEFFKEENDAFYIRGQRKAEERIVINLLKKLNYSLDQIADIAGVSVDFVKNVKQKFTSDK